ncbi:RNA-polymerase subunit [Kehishuvirus tikkala]|uniref:RNA-polymerase subunit n=1 Tax=Kehishuvirus sp. 'tikkala' TaxID=3028513 RepID=A0AAF0D4Z2_9CAUD|nr:RNA-polymerase subunit [Kehishuvirus sp. 'tikkala']
MANNQQIQDPSTQGVGGLRGIKSIDALKQEGLLRDVPLINNIEEYKQVSNRALERAVPQEVGFVGVGDSMYDEGITSMTQLDNLANTRGELQPWYAQIGAGLAKGAVLAGTTFADGIIGTIVGLGNAAATGTFSGFWDNPFSNAMQQVNEWSESALPNYYADAEKNDPWYENIFSANFIGDKFLKNLGFAVGAAYSGKISAGATSKLLGLNKARQAFKGAVTASGEALNTNAALQAYREGDLFLDGVRLTEELARDAKKLKMAEPTLKLTGAFSGALGEARIEAIQNSKDWFELHKQQLDDAQAKVAAQEQEAMLREFPQFAQYQISSDGKSFEQVLTPEGQAMLQARVDAKFDYKGGLQKLSEDRAKMGNIDFALNIPLLTVSDAWQFGKFYAGGYNTAKKGSQILRTVAEDGTVSYSAAKPSVLRNALKIASKGVAEGPYEEMGQAVAGKVAGYKYASELNDFYGAKIDPDAESETIDWLQATAKAIQQTYGTVEGWEEGFIGGLTGLVGIPGFRSARNSEGGFQSPVYLQGGIKEDIQEIRERSEQDDAIVAQLNNRVQSPEFLNYYQSAIRHNAYQRQMDEAADNNDNFEFKNAEHNQLISDVIMFDKAGRINDLYDIIEEAGNIREEDVEQIRQLTTNQETGTSVYDNMTDAEVIEQVQKQTQETKEAVDNYRKISQDLQVKIGDYFDEDGLEEMTYYFSNIDNLENRFKSVHEDIKDRLQGVLDASMDREFISDSDENKINRLSDLLNYSPVRLINELADSKEAQAYISLLDKALQTDPNKQDIIDEVNDLHKIAERRLDFIDKYDTYLRNPQALAQKQERQRENIIKENERQEIAKTKDAALAATNLNEFREALNNEPDSSKRLQILDELENEGNKMAKDYKEVQMYNSEVSRAIDRQPISPEAKANAQELLRTQHENANNLEEMANPNSVFINNPESLYDENLPDDLNMMNFAEAQYGLLSAMSEVNNDQRFKARFPSEYLKPVERTDGTKGTTSKDTTGDSGTTTVPPVNAGPVDTYEPPVGNITPQMVAEENKKANENAPTPQSLDKDAKGKRQYYRPTIPELHINASKDGDFRPFNVVVAEKENLNFDELYNYLRDNRAFSYVNEGNLKAGDELGFMIDPEFNDHTIFIVDKRNNQIVGSLDESQYVVDRYEGLAGLIERVKEEFNQTGKDKKFIATPTTRVSQIMVGRIPYGTEERNMGEIPNVSASSIFGIVKNGILSTNGRISDDLITKPMDMSQKEGRMYILIPNAAGKYSPAAVRVKHFNESEYNPEDVTINSTPLYKNIKKSIDALANAFTEEDVNNAVKDLARSLYIGDVHIDYIQGKNGNGIRFTKVQRDANKNEIYDEVDGQRVRREDARTVFLTERWDPNVLYELGGDGVKTQPDTRDSQEVASEIQNILMAFNLPLQVNLGMLNKGGYNNMLLSSGVMTSNIIDASVKSNWFTTDYFDIQGNLQQALNPASVKAEEGRKIQTPVGGTEGAIAGTTVSFDNTTYHVDLTSNTVRDDNGRTLNSFPESILDMAYIQENYGDAQNGSMMMGGITLLPNGKVLNRNTGQYVTGAASDKFKQKLADRKKTVADSKKVIDQIAENQAKVDKTRTDGEFYYILEDDGEYHEYKRVHSVLGSNWVESPKQTKALQDLRVNLSKNADNIAQFNNYLKNLSNHYGVDLSAFEGKIDARSRDTIVNIVRDKMSGTNSQRALDAGTSVDSVIRNFFTSSEMPVKPSNMSEQAFNDLATSLTEIKSNIEARGETFLTNNIVLFNKYENGNRVAGEVDILSVDANGNFKIYDVKTSRYSFYDFVDRNGRKVNYFKNKSNTQTMSQEQYYTKQLSAYKNLFESQYHTPITTLAILPFVLEYNKDNVSRVTKEKGILLNYDSSVNVPLVGSVATPEVNNTNSSLPIFNSTFETREPINNVLPDYSMSDSKVGYFLRDGKLHTGYLSPIGKVNGVEVYMTKVPNITKGFGNQPAHVASNDFYAVFPNGNTIALVKNAVLSYSETEAKNNIKKILEGNPQRVVDMSQESTLLYTPSTEPVKIEKPIIPATINQGESNGAASTVAKEQAINQVDEEFEDVLELRQVDDLSRPIWDKDKELAWLNKVLPQLSESERVVVTNGLIRVAKTGALAWGQFSDGIITLSDIAAEGTTYHEAFHAVFHLLTEPTLRDELLQEAKRTYGDLSNSQLEEAMAEGFREYVMSQDTQSLGTKIINFFKELFAKVTNWNSLRPSLTEYYRNINEGHYSNITYKVPSLQEMRNQEGVQSSMDFSSIETETREALEKKGWTEEMWNSISQEEREQAIRCS